jgi:hypothetical protein
MPLKPDALETRAELIVAPDVEYPLIMPLLFATNKFDPNTAISLAKPNPETRGVYSRA